MSTSGQGSSGRTCRSSLQCGELFQPARVASGEVALAIEVALDGALRLNASLRGDADRSSARRDQLDETADVVAAVCDHLRRRQPCEQGRRRRRPI